MRKEYQVRRVLVMGELLHQISTDLGRVLAVSEDEADAIHIVAILNNEARSCVTKEEPPPSLPETPKAEDCSNFKTVMKEMFSR